ncbi:MAG: AAA domain-containing protein [Chloroherpetonaceae bacterium]|nr:DUF4011 domain-containing protein [Chthonomonadaceae bacterium]MDW8209111.1 AAA domain-containing protein [Chloroherpetonaceae bacterium]
MPEHDVVGVDPAVKRLVDAARDVWIRRLVDYSRSNPLLFYRDLKTGTLDLSRRRDTVQRLLTGRKVAVDALVAPRRSGVSGGALEEPDRELADVRHRLVAIRRKAVSNMEEKGLETLYLAVGMAQWPAVDGGRDYQAPVLLLPARIETRGRAGGDMQLSLTEERQLNPVLLYALEDNYGIVLREEEVSGQWDVEGSEGRAGFWLEEVFRAVERAAAGVPGFRVQRDRAVLANFHFKKITMVQDLKQNGDVLAAHPIVAAIAGHAPSRQRLAQGVVDIRPAQLDERPASSEYLVLDADSSQRRVVILASRGQSGVIQGPPGTGKSQTIANLIAQCVAEGRRVLFVAEKRAALDAVIKRLTQVGLGHLVLDLHDASTSRKEVMRRIGQTLEEIRNTPVLDGEEQRLHADLESSRTVLNRHAQRMNEKCRPVELSLHEILGRILRLPPEAKTTLRLDNRILATLTPERLRTIHEWIHDGATHASLFLGTDLSPWNGAEIPDGERAQAAVELVRYLLEEVWRPFEELLEQLVQELAVRAPGTLNEVVALLSLVQDIQGIYRRYRGGLFALPLEEMVATLAPADRLPTRVWAFVSNGSFRAARRHLLQLRYARVPVQMLRQEALEALAVLERWRLFSPGSAVPPEVSLEKRLWSLLATFREKVQELGAIVRAPGRGVVDFCYGRPLEQVRMWLEALVHDRRSPFLLPHLRAVRRHLQEAGLGAFVEELRAKQVAPAHWSDRFDYLWLYSMYERAQAVIPELATFQGQGHEYVVANFRRLDRECVKVAARRVRHAHAQRAIEAMNRYPDQDDLLRREVGKKARHMSLRDLLARTSDVLLRVFPCWVASPLSVSQLIDGRGRYFDLVVFDEASQILQEEAIPAIYRAGQVVAAGDQHQLPPTTFFATTVEGEDDAGDTEDARSAVMEAIGGFDSLLETLAAFLPNWLLEWHYRSEDERLIAFSNAHIYSRRLITFPSARLPEGPIRHVLVPHSASAGDSEESASGEVRAVVAMVLQHAETCPRESLGVITMGIKHAQRIQGELDRVLAQREDLADFFALDREERFFVKNLETVQGDERDVIFLSIGYGKNARGDLPHRFGPLTQDVGYRRLNVAITRARKRMCVISSFSHHDVDLTRSGSRGVQLLKAFLEYASRGGEQVPDLERADEMALNAFEADVRDALEARGIRTRAQFGASGYRIDLVAMHPERPGQPVLAIECDGASYHSCATARDRDRLRQAQLERRGWRFHRIWSTDWFHNREQEIARVMAAYTRAVRSADCSERGEDPVQEEEPAAPPLALEVRQRTEPRPRVPAYESIEQYTDAQLIRIARWILSDGLRRTDQELVEAIFRELPLRRMGSRIRERLEAVVRQVRS